MSELLDKLVEGAGQAISQVDQGGKIESVITGLRQRLAEADRKRKVTLVKQQIRDLRVQEEQAIKALSTQVLALHEAGTLSQPELVSLCRNVDAIREQLREREADLKALQPPSPPSPPSAAETRCPHCGVVLATGATFCQSCGSRLASGGAAPPSQFCIHCGAQLRETARFCPKCGQTVE